MLRSRLYCLRRRERPRLIPVVLRSITLGLLGGAGVLGAALGGLAVGHAVPASAQEPVDYSRTMRLAATTTAVPDFTLCQADADWLYTFRSGTLRVVDLSNPLAPAVYGSLTDLGTVADFVVAGDQAYLARGTTGLTVVDLTDRAHPSIAGTLALPDSLVAVALYGSLVAVGGGSTFYLVDTTNPDTMGVVGQTGTIAVSDLAITNAYSLVTGTHGISTIDLTDPAFPTQVAMFRDDVGDFAEVGLYPEFSTIVVDGARAAVCSRQYVRDDIFLEEWIHLAPHVVTLDVSNPLALRNLAGRWLNAIALRLRGDRVLATNDGCLRVYDVETMAPRGFLAGPGAMTAFAWGDRFLYANRVGGLGIYDLTYAGTVVPFAVWGAGGGHSAWSPRYVLEKRETYDPFTTYIDYDIIETTDALQPRVRLSGSLQAGTSETGAYVEVGDAQGDLLVFCSNYASFQIYCSILDMTRHPPREGFLPWPDLYAVRLAGTVAWVTTEDFTLAAVDCSDVQAMRILAQVQVPSRNLQMDGGHSWLAWGVPPQIAMLDLSDPTAPQVCGAVTLPGPAGGTSFRGSLGYISCEGAGLQVVDVSDLQAPAIVGEAGSVLAAKWIVASSDLAVLANSTGFQILSLADPAAPRILSPVVGVPGLYGKPVIRQDRLYVGHCYGMNVYDVSNPDHPVYVGCGSGVNGSILEGETWLVAAGGAYPLDASVAVAVEDHAPLPALAPIASLAVAPNPFNPLTTVRFAITGTHEVIVGIYDLRGALRRRLVSGRWAEGEHEVKWDGCDDGGRPLGSGTYLVRLRIDGGAATCTEKVALVR